MAFDALGDRAYWTHKECDQLVVFDMSGGFCTGCHAENLDEDDLIAPEIGTATIPERRETP